MSDAGHSTNEAAEATTSANAVALGLSVYAEARRPGLDGILEMIP